MTYCRHLRLAIIAFTLTFATWSWAAPSQFIVAPHFAAGNFPETVALGDFNGDGKLDIVLLQLGNDNVIVRLNSGHGKFQAPKAFSTGVAFPSVVSVADVNRDNKPDLVVFNDPSDGSNATVSILLGNGDGTFQAPKTATLGSFPAVVAFADFNGDGKLDMVAANVGFLDMLIPPSLLVLTGNGDGTFQPAKQIFTSCTPLWVAVGDFNNDGKVDLAVANGTPQAISILLGNGDGTFQTAKNFVGVGSPLFVAAEEMDTDHNLDLVVSTSNNSVAILRGNGDGTFQNARNFPAGVSPTLFNIGDFNGDGKLDVAALPSGGGLGGGPISVMLGNGDDTLGTPALYDAGGAVAWMAAGDLLGNHKLDLITVNSAKTGSLTFLQGKGDGTFLAARSFATLASPGSGVAGDFNSDGKPDLVFLSGFPNELSVLLGNGDGTFQPVKNTAEGTTTSIAIGDFNHDGKLDLALTDGEPNNLDVRLGNGDGTFQTGKLFPLATFPVDLAIGDFNNDGNLDVLVAESLIGQNGDLQIFLGKGDGTFKAGQQIPFQGATQVVVGDFNRDGNLDFIVAEAPFTNLTLFLGKGDGTFKPPINLQPNGGGFILVTDLNKDGKLDLVIGVQGGSQFNQFGLNVMLGNGDGTFQNAVFTPLPLHNPPFLAAEDFNRDGNVDVVASSFADSSVVLALGDGKGSFGTPTSFPIASTPGDFAVADFNLDQAPDLAVGIPGQAGAMGTGSVTVLLNSGSH